MSHLSDQDRANIHRVLVDWVHGLVNGDVWLATRAYADDAVMDVPGPAVHQGRVAIEAALRRDAGAGLHDVPVDLGGLREVDADTVVVDSPDPNPYPLVGDGGCIHRRELRRDGFLWQVVRHTLLTGGT